MPRLKTKIAFSLLAILLLLVTHVQADDTAEAKPAIKIGVDYAFTGAAQAFSDYGRMALELAREEINETGGINGRKIELIYEDSRTLPAESVSAYQKLVTLDRVKIVIGNVWAFLTIPLIPLVETDQVLLISPTVMPESVQITSPYFFSMGERIESIHDAADLFFKKNPDVKRVGVFCGDDSWGQAYLNVWKRIAEANGAKIELELCSQDFAHDYATDVSKMKRAKVDAVIIAHFGDRILRRMKEQSFHPKVLGTGNLIEDIKLKKAPVELFEGIYLTQWKPSEEFREKFLKKYGTEPLMHAHGSYEVLRSLAQALSKGEKDLHLRMKQVRYQGVTGEIDFSQSSFGNLGQAKLYRVHAGEPEIVQ